MNRFVERLGDAQPVLAVNPGGMALAAIDAVAAHGAEALFIDCERSPVGIAEAAWMARAARAAGLLVLLRTESDHPEVVTRYLDCRIDALIVPQVESRSACDRLAGLGAVHAASAPRTALVAQIESRAGHDALDAIATAPGIDAILIGPNDLAASMGRPGQPRDPQVEAAVADIAARLAALRMPFGLPVDASSARDWSQRGARLFYLSLPQLLGLGLATIRKAMG